MGLADDLDDAANPLAADVVRLERALAQARADRDTKARALKATTSELHAVQRELDAATRIDHAEVDAAPWSPSKRSRKNRATAVLMLSDWHFDEVVDPAQVMVDGEPLNAYDRRIAGMRLRRCVEHAIVLAQDLLRWEWDGLTLLLGGDMVSGSIHDELGHWHTFLPGMGWTINSSGKGTDEYSYQGNFGHEEPSQAFGVVTPERNVTAVVPVWVADRKSEGW